MDIDRVYRVLKRRFSEVKTPIVDLIGAQTKDPYKVLVATILSARTRDGTTAGVISRLFKKADNPKALAKLTQKEIETLIHPIGFFRNKAKFLKKLPGVLEERFGGNVPSEIDDLLQLPGVGRKTANLVRAVAFQKPAICVDVHVHRIMNRLGYVKTRAPQETEMALRETLPEKYWITINAYMVAFGQNHCTPRNPRCSSCEIYDECARVGVETKYAKGAGPSSGLTLVSWNVNGLRAAVKKGFLDYLREEAPDILAVQETKCQPDQVPEEVCALTEYHQYYHSAERKGYSGVALYSREEPNSVSASIGEERFDCEGRVLRADYDSFTLFNVYFPNGTSGEARLAYKMDFFDHFFGLVDDLIAGGRPVLVCGDYNIAHKPIDLARPKANEENSGFLPEERAILDSLVARGYIDTFRCFHEDPEQYSWWSYRFGARGKNIGWRIDYFFASASLAGRLEDAWIRPEVMGSDHCPVGLVLK